MLEPFLSKVKDLFRQGIKDESITNNRINILQNKRQQGWRKKKHFVCHPKHLDLGQYQTSTMDVFLQKQLSFSLFPHKTPS